MLANGILRAFASPIITARGGEGGVAHRSDEAHVQYWTGSDIPVEINAERLLIAYEAWVASARNGVPRLGDLLASEASAAVGDALLHLKVNNEYLVVSQGADHMRHIGRDMRGLLLSDVNARVAPVLGELYDQCLARNEAIYSRFISQVAPDRGYWEGLFLPLKGDYGGHSRFVMNYNTPIDNKADILQMILDRSPVGMIAAIPLGDDKNNIDGRIVSINARAKGILKLDENGSHIHYIRDLVPWFRDKAGWTRTSVASKGLKTWLQYRDNKSNREYAVTMEPLKRFILFSIAEIGTAEGARLACPPP
jgi:hypothetical protein